MAATLPLIPEAWKNDRANDIESVTVESSPPPSDGATWEARVYFSNAKEGGRLAVPKNAVHGGIKIYRNGRFSYSIDAAPQLGRLLKDETLGNLVFQRDPDSMSANRAWRTRTITAK